MGPAKGRCPFFEFRTDRSLADLRLYFLSMLQRWTSILYVDGYWWNWLWSSFRRKYLNLGITAPCEENTDVADMWTCELENTPAPSSLLPWHCNSSRSKFEPGTVPPRMKDVTCICEYSKFRGCKYPGYRNGCCRTLVEPRVAIKVNCILTVLSGLRRDVEICAVMGYCLASSGTPLPTFRGNVSVF